MTARANGIHPIADWPAPTTGRLFRWHGAQALASPLVRRAREISTS
jgi:hypothetical protein